MLHDAKAKDLWPLRWSVVLKVRHAQHGHVAVLVADTRRQAQ